MDGRASHHITPHHITGPVGAQTGQARNQGAAHSTPAAGRDCPCRGQGVDVYFYLMGSFRELIPIFDHILTFTLSSHTCTRALVTWHTNEFTVTSSHLSCAGSVMLSCTACDWLCCTPITMLPASAKGEGTCEGNQKRTHVLSVCLYRCVLICAHLCCLRLLRVREPVKGAVSETRCVFVCVLCVLISVLPASAKGEGTCEGCSE